LIKFKFVVIFVKYDEVYHKTEQERSKQKRFQAQR